MNSLGHSSDLESVLNIVFTLEYYPLKSVLEYYPLKSDLEYYPLKSVLEYYPLLHWTLKSRTDFNDKHLDHYSLTGVEDKFQWQASRTDFNAKIEDRFQCHDREQITMPTFFHWTHSWVCSINDFNDECWGIFLMELGLCVVFLGRLSGLLRSVGHRCQFLESFVGVLRYHSMKPDLELFVKTIPRWYLLKSPWVIQKTDTGIILTRGSISMTDIEGQYQLSRSRSNSNCRHRGSISIIEIEVRHQSSRSRFDFNKRLWDICVIFIEVRPRHCSLKSVLDIVRWSSPLTLFIEVRPRHLVIKVCSRHCSLIRITDIEKRFNSRDRGPIPTSR